MRIPSQYNEEEDQNIDEVQIKGTTITLWGSVISIIGDAIQTIGEAITIEEIRISEVEEQQQMQNIQNELTELRKLQSKNYIASSEIDKLNELMEKIILRMDK